MSDNSENPNVGAFKSILKSVLIVSIVFILIIIIGFFILYTIGSRYSINEMNRAHEAERARLEKINDRKMHPEKVRYFQGLFEIDKDIYDIKFDITDLEVDESSIAEDKATFRAYGANNNSYLVSFNIHNSSDMYDKCTLYEDSKGLGIYSLDNWESYYTKNGMRSFLLLDRFEGDYALFEFEYIAETNYKISEEEQSNLITPLLRGFEYENVTNTLSDEEEIKNEFVLYTGAIDSD